MSKADIHPPPMEERMERLEAIRTGPKACNNCREGAMKIRVVITISGKVQGVGFRRHAVEAALRHGVTGWVKNLHNGDVQLCLEGERRHVGRLIEWCRKGPPLAEVRRITIDPSIFRGEFTEFVII